MAFKSWQSAPWGKHITFDIFCETVLPYRVYTEPLENWREQALASFADVYRNLLNSDSMTAVEACREVSGKLPSFKYNTQFPDMTYTQLMASTCSDSEQQSALALFVMRSMGIPVTFDVMLQPVLNHRIRNMVYDSAGRLISPTPSGQPDNHWFPSDEEMISKAYRYDFRRQEHPACIPSKIPHPFASLIDVTPEYCNVMDIEISAPGNPQSEYVCLAVANSLSEWRPAVWGKYHEGKYHFTSLGGNTLYMPFLYDNGQQTPFDQPFFVTDSGKIISFEHCKQDSTKTSAAYPRWRNVRYKAGNIEMTNALSGRWLFEDTVNYGKATVGKDLTTYKMTEPRSKGKPSNQGLRRVEGPIAGKNAVRVPRYSYFKCTHGVPHNGSGKNINEYTILMDFKLPVQDEYCFFQTDMDNISDMDMYLYKNLVHLGVSRFYCNFDPSLRANEWYRLVISANLGHSLKYYLNGELVFVNYNTKLGTLDSRLSLSKDGLLLFADNDGEDSDIDVSEAAIFNRALSEEEVFSLGNAGNELTMKN
jgi:hypothetical protein